ncbi:MADS-box transcription factor 30 [Striga asiatica]|uniref:MADS-box transcription factor 30 n=1 Tax=Striga asiatica TaxID=4170 RepID=A0A5A7PS89_STRAF|nr:MADS-box transcription factor 30 [Striga asiatica]
MYDIAMGRKIDMKKIEDVTKCQVTFSKRRSSLMKKANEIAVCCDIDVAFVAFSPSGRVSKFCNQKRIEDVLHRYVNLPPECRLKDYELDPEQEPSLHQLSWCERNIKNSIERVIARKSVLFGNSSTSSTPPNFQMELENQDNILFSSNLNENESTLTPQQNPTTGQILMQLDPWISPYRAIIRDNIFQDALDPSGYMPNMNPGPSNASNFPIPPNICNFPIQHCSVIFESEPMVKLNAQIPPSQIPPQQPFGVLDQALPSFPREHNVNAWNNFSTGLSKILTQTSSFPNAIQDFTQSVCNSQLPRFAFTTMTTTTTPHSDQMNTTNTQYADLNLNPFSSTIKDEIGQLNLNLGNGSSINNNEEQEEDRPSKRPTTGQDEDPYQVHPQLVEARQDTTPPNPQPEEALGERTVWTTNVEKSNLWEWEDLLLDENFNFGNVSK